MNKLLTIIFAGIFSIVGFSASAGGNEFTPKMKASMCKLYISAYKKTKAQTGKGENVLVANCPGYTDIVVPNENNYQATGLLFKAMKKRPKRVKVAGAGSMLLWERLILIGTPKEIALKLLEEKEFWNAVKEINKHPDIARKNKRKGIVTN
jgi:hypothetical protein